MARNDFRGDPRGSARSRRAHRAGQVGPQTFSAGEFTTTGLTVDGSNLLSLADQSGELTAISSGQTINGIYTVIDAAGTGAWRQLQFGAGCILVYDAVKFILPGNDSISTAAGDVGTFYCSSGTANAQGNWICVEYTRGGMPPRPSYNLPSALTAAGSGFNTFMGVLGTAYNYSNGTAGIGATITFTATGTQTINGTTLSLGKNVLAQADAQSIGDAAGSGLYTVTTAGAIGVAAVWTRSTSMDTSEKFVGALVLVLNAPSTTKAGNSVYICTNQTPPVVGTDLVVFSEAVSSPDLYSVSGPEMAGWTRTAQNATTYTLASTDYFRVVECNNISAITVTIPKTSVISTPNTTGAAVWIVSTGNGLTTLAAATGVTLNLPANESLKLAKNQMVCLINNQTDSWVILFGARPADGTSLSLNTSGQLQTIAGGTSPVGAALTSGNIWVGSGTNVAAAVGVSGSGATITLSNAGVLTISAIDNASLVNSSITIGGSATALGGSALGSVTNDAQTKAAIVPNTAPSSGQVLVGNAGGTAYAKQTVSGSGATITMSSAGVLTISAIANASLSSSTITINGASTSLGGSVSVGTVTSVATAGLATGGAITTTGTVTVTAAVKSDQTTASSTAVAVVPGVQQNHPSAVKAWVNFHWTGAAISIVQSYNVTSVTRNGTGDYTITFTTSFADTGYTMSGAAVITSATTVFVIESTSTARAVGAMRIQTVSGAGGSFDPAQVNVMFAGNQ